MKFIYCFLLFYSLFSTTSVGQKELTIKSQSGNLLIIDGYSQAHTDLTKEQVNEMGTKAGFRLLFYEKPSWHLHVVVKE